MEAPGAGPTTPRTWSAPGKAAEYRPHRVRTLLRPRVDGGDWYWTLDPYDGCELACVFCHARLDRGGLPDWREFEQRVGAKVNAPQVLRVALRTQDLEGRPLVLGVWCEPWQPAEERFRITRELLGVLAEHEGLDVRVNTRSALVARDADRLRAIAERGRVTVTFSMSSLDEGLCRLLEPRAPPVRERLEALGVLARAGVRTGVQLSPVLPGLSPEELGLAPLLSRAAEAGACYAGFQYLGFGPGQRENFIAHAQSLSPELAALVRRVGGMRQGEREHRELVATFEAHRDRLGLAPLHDVMALPPRITPEEVGPQAALDELDPLWQ